MPVQPKKIKDDKRNGDVRCRAREQICAVAGAAEPLLQIEKRKPAIFLEGDNFTIENQLFLEVPGLIRQLGELTGDAPQITRENVNALRAAMKLRSDPVEFIFQIYCSWRL